MHPDVFTVLNAPQRRRIIADLVEHEPQSADPRFETGQPTPSEIQRESIRMHHVHLPMLADHGFIRWDRETGEVERGPEFETVEAALALTA